MRKPTISTVNTLKFLIFSFLILFALESFAQSEIKFYAKEKIKKENGGLGVRRKNVWTIPPKYDKIEGYRASIHGYLVCYKGAEVDIYENGYNQELVATNLNQPQLETFRLYAAYPKIPMIKDKKWEDAVDNLTPSQINLFNDMKSTGNIPYIKNGKWGFANEFYNIEPQYDSLFVIYNENSQEKTGDVVGVVINNKKGVVTNQGKEIALHKDYVSFRYRFTGGSNGKFEIICTHKSGIEVVYNRYSKNEFIPTENNAGLKGYVYKGEFIEPKYTDIKPSRLQVADYECTLPNGSVEYLKGSRLVPANVVNENREKIAEEDKKRSEAIKEKEEIAAKAKELALRKQETLLQLIETKKDSLVNGLVSLYFKNDTLLFNKIAALLEFLKTTMVVDDRGNINRNYWPSQSLVIRNNYCKEANKQLKAYETDTKRFAFVAGKINLYDATIEYLKGVNGFVSSCEQWADYIFDKSGDNQQINKMIGYIENSSQNMNKKYALLRGIVKEVLNSKNTTRK